MNHSRFHTSSGDEIYLRDIHAGGPKADQAMAALYLKYRGKVLRALSMLISRRQGRPDGAEDLMHDAFLVLIQKIQFESADIRTVDKFWIGIGKHLFMNQLKKDDRIHLVMDEEEVYGLSQPSPESEYLQNEAIQEMANSFTFFGPACKEILLLWLNKYSMHEIARELHLSSDAMARKKKHECFKKLKEWVRNGHKIPG